MLRHEWSRLTANRCWMSREEMLDAWRQSMGKDSRQDTELLDAALNDVFRKAALSCNGRIEEVEWIHFRLLEIQAPSFHSLVQVNDQLRRCLKWDPSVLQRLLNLFESASDVKDGEAWLTAAQMQEVAKQWITERDSKQDLPSAAMREAVAYLQKRVAENEVWEEDGVVTYYDFMNHMLGRRKVKVQIYLYDMSGGRAAYLSPLLLGRRLEGIWHSGVVVHGKEYWYGGSIFESTPGKTPFGEPSKIIDMPEYTMRSRGDLWNYIRRQLVKEFTSETYDVLSRNCNHFSDTLCGFLLDQRLPDSVLRQPEILMDSWAAQLLRPLLNRALGQFSGQEDGTTAAVGACTKLLDKECSNGNEARDDWSCIALGSLVAYEYENGWTCVARVIRRGEHVSDLKWLDVSSGKMGIKLGVPRESIQPYPRIAAFIHP